MGSGHFVRGDLIPLRAGRRTLAGPATSGDSAPSPLRGVHRGPSTFGPIIGSHALAHVVRTVRSHGHEGRVISVEGHGVIVS